MHADLASRIAARAYERFLARGGAHGHDVEDWLAAEAEMVDVPHDVMLADAGPNTIELVRAIRELTGMGLREIRGLLDELPQRLSRVQSLSAATTMRGVLEPLGARVEIRTVE